MAKKALFDVLERTIGKYVRNLDAESLNVAVWSGKIELNSLELDVDAVNDEIRRQSMEAPNLAIPFRVLSGQFTSFQVDVPWAHLMSQPVILRAQGLQVSVEPYDHLAAAESPQSVQESESTRVLQIQSQRAKSLQIAEEYRQQTEQLRKLAGQDMETSSSTFGNRLVRRIIENIQVEIGDVHISLKGNGCSAGVTLDSFQLVTTDKMGRRTFVDRTAGVDKNSSFLHKEMQIRGLGIYVDEDAESRALPSIREDVDDDADTAHSFVIAPLSFVAKLRQADSTVCRDYPKYLLESKVHALCILLSKNQLESMRRIQDQMQSSGGAIVPLFPEYRPLVRIAPGTSARQWWLYAYRCVGRLSGRSSWRLFMDAYRKRKTYIPLYKRHAFVETCPWLSKLSIDEQVELQRLEEDRTISVEGLITWRNIASSQVEKERVKYAANASTANTAKGNIFTSLFGSSVKKETLNEQPVDEPPIALSADELKELESLAMDQVADAELSKDSRLCDIKFVLGSLDTQLLALDLRTLAGLEMGAVSASFNANVDGSYTFDFSMTSLAVTDRVTPNSYFPKILQNLETPDLETRDVRQNALHAFISRTKAGDQKVKMRLNTFEAIASPKLLVEMIHFITKAKPLKAPQITAMNPVLAQSMSGSVDLFYDANQGSASALQPIVLPDQVDESQSTAFDPSLSLINAWKSKTENKAAWVIDLDIQAPIVIVPESCENPQANVFMFNLGHFHLKYGSEEASGLTKKVHNWFEHNPANAETAPNRILDHGSLNIDTFSFNVGTVFERQNQGGKSPAHTMSRIFEPVSLETSFAIEATDGEDVPRFCLFGIIPAIELNIKPLHLSRLISVMKYWMRLLSETSIVDPPNDYGNVNETQIMEQPASQRLSSLVDDARRGSVFLASLSTARDVVAMLHLDFTLKKLSVRIESDDTGSGLEGHLVAVSVTFSSNSDSSSSTRLSMGWFWILDHLKNDFPRRQRMLVHSRLPAVDGNETQQNDEVMQQLEALGVFSDDFAGSSELADIRFFQAANHTQRDANPFCSLDTNFGGCSVDAMLDARFTTLNINWNPQAIKQVVATMETMFAFLSPNNEDGTHDIILSSPNQLAYWDKKNSADNNGEDGPSRVLLVKAAMESFGVCLNSARDDLPLFVLTMSTTKCTFLSSGENMKMSFTVDDLNMTTPETGKTLPAYRTIVGLAPGHAESLLSVNCSNGPIALQNAAQSDVDLAGYETYACVELSPMRLVYIHAQIMSLVEYTTEGILGAIAASAATSAAQVAAELVVSTQASKLFRVRATGLEFWLPRGAYCPDYLLVQTGDALVDYVALPSPGGGRASLSLARVMIGDSSGLDMVDRSVDMRITVELPPFDVGTIEDQATRVSLVITEAPFILSKGQYQQILETLQKNIGEVDLCLRDNKGGDVFIRSDDSQSGSNFKHESVTHAGGELIEIPRRMYIEIHLTALSLMLVLSNQDEPLVGISAVQGKLRLSQLGDMGSMKVEVTLKDLVCTDERIEAIGRQQRSLVYQGEVSSEQDVFFVSYETSADQMTQIQLSIGSPQLVFVPDAVSELLAFFDGGQVPPTVTVDDKKAYRSIEEFPVDKSAEVDASTCDYEIETSLIHSRHQALTKTKISIKTSVCSVWFVDLGSSVLLPSTTSKLPIPVSSLAESIVLEGVFELEISMSNDKVSGDAVSTEAEIHANALEAYTTYYGSLSSPLQILEPAQISFHLLSVSKNKESEIIDVRAASLSPLDVSLSMKNVALVNAILTSIDECFETTTRRNEVEDWEAVLTENQTAAIEDLAAALQENSCAASPSNHDTDQTTASLNTSVESSKPSLANSKTVVSVKVTIADANVTLINDLQGLDEALARLTVRSMMAGAQLRMGDQIVDRSSEYLYTGIDFTLHTSIFADYFDSSVNQWKTLLVKPWEVASKIRRGASSRFNSLRPSTTIDIESFPLYMQFSEQFLMALSSANYMWKVYTAATESAVESTLDERTDTKLRKSMAASAARTLIKTPPFAIENHLGIGLEFIIPGGDEKRRVLANGTIEYFRFDPPRGAGRGGKRCYGQDISYTKSVTLFLGNTSVELKNLDEKISLARTVYELDGKLFVCSVVKEGKTVVFHLSSGFDLYNHTCVPFSVAVESDRENIDIGVCDAGFHRDADVKAHGSVIQGRTRNAAVRFGVPLDCLGNYRSMWEQSGVFQLTVGVYPIYHGEQTLKGSLAVSLERRLLNPLEAITTRYDVACCSSEEGSREDSLVFQVLVVAELVNGYPVLDITFQPRATLENSMPIPLQVQTPMPHTYSESIKPSQECTKVIHSLNPGQRIEIFTPGPSIAVTMKCKDLPVAGTTTDWMEGWVDLPLVSQFRLPEPLICSFPFARNVADPLGMNGAHNTPFLIAEGSESLTMDNFKKASAQLDERSLGDEVEVSFCSPTDETAFFVTVYNYAVDHTGDILIEQVSRPSHHAFRRSMSNDPSSHMRSSLATRLVSAPLGAFSTTNRNLRVSLLPETDTPIRILQLTMEGDEGLRKGTQFCVDDIAICDGGALSTPMYWEDGRPSGYFAYRKLVSLTQSEVHIVPEYIVFNGSESRTVRVKQPGGLEFRLTSGNIGALKIHSEETAAIAIEFESGARTALLRVDSLGLRMAVVKSYDGHPIGSIALQTVVGGADSRLVVKLGELKLGSAATLAHASSAVTSALDKDFLRIRVQCSQLSLTLIQAGTVVQPHQAFMESALDRIRETASPGTSQRPTWFDARSHRESSESDAQRAVCTVLFHRFTIDWQRVFKDDTQSDRATAMATRDASRSIERSQLSVIIHNVQLRDETPGSAYPIVFDSTSNVSFFDLCVRFRGSLDSELVKIDLFDLNLAHGNGESKPIVVNTSEEFIWHLLDVTNRIIVAAGEFVGVNIELKWDDEHGGYTVKYSDKNATIAKDEMKYTPPKSDTLYDINQARVSPFTMLVSFKRIPQSSRYKRMSGVPGANIINYFTTRLKFKIDRAELKFSRYEARNIKGPPDHLLEMLSTVYLSRMKLKLVSIMTAASFQDWKKLAARDGGDDEFVEGDLLRVTGNIAGNSVSYILKKAGMGLGQGISSVTHALGDGIENATDAIGARAVGAGVNSLVSGVGDGVGGALSGVGSGAGKVVKGVGQGVGQVFGGLSGGVLMMGKGIGKGLVHGDGRMMAAGLAEGATSVGAGVGQGVESVVQGTTSGVFTVGSGLFSGIKSIGKGVSGAFTALCSCSLCCCADEEETTNDANNAFLTSPLLPNAHNII